MNVSADGSFKAVTFSGSIVGRFSLDSESYGIDRDG